MHPADPDPFPQLRAAWLTRLCDSKLVHLISNKLKEGPVDNILQPAQLEPFLNDLGRIFNLSADDFRIAPEQPFRLEVWKVLASAFHDLEVPFLDLLADGVPLGVDEPLPPSPYWPQQPAAVFSEEPLRICASEWNSAKTHAALVDELLKAELEAGFIEEVVGGVEELAKAYGKVAVGKLAVIVVEGKQPRLVVDSSVSNVTHHTALPNHMLLPKITDVVACAPHCQAQENMLALTLDVSKAHRRIKIRLQDRGLLCFRHGSKLFKSKTLNFGARVSGWYWQRLAGLMVRTFHHFLRYRHALFQYVDDLLAFLDGTTAPLWASLLVVLCGVLQIPISWPKAQFAGSVTWIGWSIDVQHWLVSLPVEKSRPILALILSVLQEAKPLAATLEKLIGKLLWVTSLWRQLRPLLAPLYSMLHSCPSTLVGFSHSDWANALQRCDHDLVLQSPLFHPRLPAGAKMLRVANTPLISLEQAQAVRLPNKRLWVSVHDPSTMSRKFTVEARESLLAWSHLLQSTPFLFSMYPPVTVNCHAYADAMAQADFAGFGGVVYFANGSVRWFRFRIHREDVPPAFTWCGKCMQSHISVWELLAQFSLSWMILTHCGPAPFSWRFNQLCDNTAAEAVSHKGLASCAGLNHVLGAYFTWMRRHHVQVDIAHIPGEQNIVADALSRFTDVESLRLAAADECIIPRKDFFEHHVSLLA